MNIWLDDIRTPPKRWVWVKTPEEAIHLLQTEDVEKISLDHDLGLFGLAGERERTGMDVLTWMEQEVVMNNYSPPLINIHTANPVARARMTKLMMRIWDLTNS